MPRFSNIKLIVSDMDGTLLDSNHKLASSFFETYIKLKEKNILFMAASGRQYFSIADKFTPILDDITIIAENGAFIKKNGTELFVEAIDIRLLKGVIEHARTLPDTYIVLCGKNGAYIEQDHEEFINYFKEFYSQYFLVDDVLKDSSDSFFKIAIYNPHGAETNLHPHFEQFKKDLQVKISGEFWVDIMPFNINKGNAINYIQKLHNISKEETLVFGDYLNDLEMFEQAGVSIAMENAHPKLKAIATQIAKSNNDNGVIDILNSNILK
jgi:Cof subfamily protein (haloacid dehalogenase superfamily)